MENKWISIRIHLPDAMPFSKENFPHHFMQGDNSTDFI